MNYTRKDPKRHMKVQTHNYTDRVVTSSYKNPLLEEKFYKSMVPQSLPSSFFKIASFHAIIAACFPL